MTVVIVMAVLREIGSCSLAAAGTVTAETLGIAEKGSLGLPLRQPPWVEGTACYRRHHLEASEEQY